MRPTVFWRRAAFALGILVATSGLLAACSSGGGDGNDEDYVKAMCESGDVLEDVLGVMISAALSGNEEDAADEVADALDEWVDALDDANPPADAADAHNALVDGIREAVKAIRDGEGDIDSAFDGMDSAPEPPQAVQDRLAAVAADTPECDGQDFFS